MFSGDAEIGLDEPLGRDPSEADDDVGADDAYLRAQVLDAGVSLLGQRITVAMDNEFAPFLRPNQYVNYENATKTMNKAAELVTGKSSLLDKVGAIYNYVTKK